MDTAGARALHDRIRQQQHWQQAPAVRSGEQPGRDPDADRLDELGEGFRLYRAERTTGPDGTLVQRLRKTLVGGRWETSMESVS